MEDKALNDMVTTTAAHLNATFGFCGLMNSTDIAILNSTDSEGNEIKVTFKVDKPDS